MAITARRLWLLVVALDASGCGGLLASEGPVDLARSEFAPGKTGALHTPSDPADRAAPIPTPQPVTQPRPEARAAMPVAAAPLVQDLPAEVVALDRNLPARLDDVVACRAEVASDRHVPAAQVPAKQVLLRYTVSPGGAVEGAEVVAERKTDPDVLSCARRKVSGWMFVRAPGGEPLNIQQRLRFE
jgi:hypothetical protein